MSPQHVVFLINVNIAGNVQFTVHVYTYIYTNVPAMFYFPIVFYQDFPLKIVRYKENISSFALIDDLTIVVPDKQMIPLNFFDRIFWPKISSTHLQWRQTFSLQRESLHFRPRLWLLCWEYMKKIKSIF